MPTLADQVDNGPMLFPSLQLLYRQVRQLGPAKPTAETERQDGSTALAPKGLDVGAVQQGSGLPGSEPVAQSDTQPLGPFHAANARRQLGAQQAGVGRLVSQSAHCSQSKVDRRGRQVTGIQLELVAQNNGLV